MGKQAEKLASQPGWLHNKSSEQADKFPCDKSEPVGGALWALRAAEVWTVILEEEEVGKGIEGKKCRAGFPLTQRVSGKCKSWSKSEK